MQLVTKQDYQFKTDPFLHQEKEFLETRDRDVYAHLWEMGTGKSKIVLDTAAWLYSQGKIRCLAVIAPNDVHRNWIDKEAGEHLPDFVNPVTACWHSEMLAAQRKRYERLFDPKVSGLRVVAFNVEAFRTGGRANKELKRVLTLFPTLLAVDESTTIKTPGAQRTKSINVLAKHAKYRRILDGTPITQGPLDLYSQFKFLDDNILGFSNFTSFKHHFGEWKKEKDWRRDVEYEVLTGYKNLDQLTQLIAPHSSRILKRECVDLPEKTYVTREVEMTAEQAHIYDEVLDSTVAELERGTVTVENVLVRLVRLQQIVGGFLHTEEGGLQPLFDWKENPRIQALLAAVKQCHGKVIIWSRYVHEIKAIQTALDATFGRGSTGVYYGEVPKEQRADVRARFQGEWVSFDAQTNERLVTPVPQDQQLRFFVGQQSSGGRGLTLTAADTVIYYSNEFSLGTRLQSEDRAHRIGQTKPVLYIDLMTPGTIDLKIVRALVAKKEVADLIMQDGPVAWLRAA